MTHIILLMLLIHLAEAIGHYWVITQFRHMNNHDYEASIAYDIMDANAKWHQCFAIMSALIWLTLSIALHDWRPLLYGAVIRLFTHQIVLNYLRGLPITHLGSGFVDRQFRRIGERTTVVLKVVMLILIFFV